MQRLRFRYGRGDAARYISHLDTVRAWERVFRRAGVPLEYTKGFTPHPRLAVASPLPVGFTSSGELMDVWLRKWMPPDAAYMLASEQLPQGFTLQAVDEVPLSLDSLQSRVAAATYECRARHPRCLEGARQAAAAFLESGSCLYEFARGEEMRTVDLRPFVLTLDVAECDSDMCLVGLRVKQGQQGSVRPDHVLLALGFCEPESIHRTELSIDP